MTTEPKRLTRANLTGTTFRIGKLYGCSELGLRIYLAYHEQQGCRDELMRKVMERMHRNGQYGFQGAIRPCSERYYARKALTWRDRERKEIEARRERGERFNMFTMRQAS
jgi:hypothetical protein